jgi:hypothetical protein
MDYHRAVTKAGSIRAAARSLGMPESTLRGKLKQTPPPPSERGGKSVSGDVEIKPADRLREKFGGSAEARYVRSLERRVGQRDYLAESLRGTLLAAFDAHPIKLSQSRIKARQKPGTRMITVMVSDIHFGLDVDSREVPGGGYNWKIAARRMARLAAEVAAWKEHYRDCTDLQVVINGDVIAGRIHLDDAGVMALTEQIHGATWILVSFVAYLRQHFARVGIKCLPGNHDRVTRERQVANRWDSHAHAIYLALAYAFRGDKHVRIDVPLTGDAVVEMPGGKSYAFYTHGDVKPSIANVGKALNIGPMVAELNRINASGEYDKPVRILGYGHWHTGFTMPTGLGTIITNGSVIGPDAFARNGCGVRGKEGAPMQVMFESVPGFEFGDCRFIHLREADKDASYDKIISAPELELWAA